jgi:hypothetical protein
LGSKNNLEALEAQGPPYEPTTCQQIAALMSGFLASFQTLGLGQAYGIFQLFHRENAGKSIGMLPDDEARSRAGIASVGSLGGSGICLILGLFMVPFLCQPSIIGSRR